MENILFLASYPTEETIKDGYYQRIKNIDNLFLNMKRIYLSIHINPKHKKLVKCKDDIEIYELNFFWDFKLISKIIKKSNKIYIHSIYKYFPAYFFFQKNQRLTLDFHGIVPEEMLFSGHRLLSFFLSKIEKKAFKRVNNVVVVTYAMKKYLQEKYKYSNVNYIFYPIISKNVLSDDNEPIVNDKITFVYAGNCQKWQRIEDIAFFIKNHDSSNYCYYLLTLNVEEMKQEIFKVVSNDHSSEIIIKSVMPKELKDFYKKGDYAFMIRDDHPLNKVANPTKMMEYLFYGMNLIVDFENIGDYKDYDFIKINDSTFIPKKGKSEKNKKVALDVLNQEVDDLKSIVISG